MAVRTTRDIHCILTRFSNGHNSCAFLHTVWRHYSASVRVFTFLTPADQHRLARAHVVIFVDRSEVALSATSSILGFDSILSSFSVPTPPVQVWTVASGSDGDQSPNTVGPEAEMGGFGLTGLS